MKTNLQNISNKYGTLVSILIVVTIVEVYLFNYNFVGLSEYLFYAKSKGFVKVGAYVIINLVSILALSLIIFIKNRLLLFSLSLILIVSYATTLSYQLINGTGFGFTELQVLNREANKFTLDVLFTYSSYLYQSLFTIMGLSLLFYGVRRLHINKYKLYFHTSLVLFLLIFSGLSSFAMVYKTIGFVSAFPTPIKFFDTVLFYTVARTYDGEREQVTLEPKTEPKYKNIIWIIDESVGGVSFY